MVDTFRCGGRFLSGGGGVILGIQSDCGECVPKSIDNEKHFMFIYIKKIIFDY